MYIVRYKDTKETIRVSNTPISTTGEVVGLDPNIEVLEVIPPVKPPYNPATEKLVLALTDVTDNGVLKVSNTYKVTPLNQDELDAVAAINLANDQRQQARAAIGDLSNGVGTTTERLARIEKVLVRMILDLYH